jgi:hypothetical protein
MADASVWDLGEDLLALVLGLARSTPRCGLTCAGTTGGALLIRFDTPGRHARFRQVLGTKNGPHKLKACLRAWGYAWNDVRPVIWTASKGLHRNGLCTFPKLLRG